MRLEILVGMIASGKSTYALKRADEGALIVAHDGLAEMLHGRYRYEQGLRECYRSMEERIVHAALWYQRDVVIDRTHLTRESRKRWVDFAVGRCPIIAVAFPIESPGEHAVRRFEADPRGRSFDDWMAVANHHRGQAMDEPLGDDEGFNEIVYRKAGDDR